MKTTHCRNIHQFIRNSAEENEENVFPSAALPREYLPLSCSVVKLGKSQRAEVKLFDSN